MRKIFIGNTMNKGRVFSIEEFSIHDGPGIRITVFLKGCPLRCVWCHSPEGVSYEKQMVKSPNGCLNCGNCIKASEEKFGVSKLTTASVSACPQRLIRECGEDYSAQELTDKILKKAVFLEDGGVTFSGGEPLLQAEFLIDCLKILDGKVHRAIQTSGYAKPEIFNKVLENVDYVLFDLKIMDVEKSIEYTSKDNSQIKQNFITLAKSGKEFVVRVPLIPTITDTEENVTKIAQFMSENGAKKVELMPYHKLTGSKYAMVGEKYTPPFDQTVLVNCRENIFGKYGISIKIL